MQSRGFNLSKLFADIQTDSYVMARHRRLLRVLKGAEIGMGQLASMTAGHDHLDLRIWAEIDERTPVIGIEGAYYFQGRGRRARKWLFPDSQQNGTRRGLWDNQELALAWLERFGQARNPIACCTAALGLRWGIDFLRLKPTGGF
jgi:hypothetical protein